MNLNNDSILIPCSGKKINQSGLIDKVFNFENLTFNDEIGEERKIIFEKLSEVQQINLNKSNKAYIVYSAGKILSSANINQWNEDCIDRVYILSALFGLIKATDYIPLYDLAMNDKIENESVLKFWKRSGELDKLIDSLNKNDVMIINLLSKNYNNVFNYDHKNLITLSIQWNDKYGVHKGKWLSEYFCK
jgi:cytoplasmic iron level regulating protein YaaA (DUF328/UPF0246 family)